MGCGVVERHLEMAQPTKKTKKKNKHKLARKFFCRIRPRIRVYGETNDW